MKSNLTIPLLIMMAVLLSGCQLVGGIFDASIWGWVLASVIVIIFFVYLITRIKE